MTSGRSVALLIHGTGWRGRDDADCNRKQSGYQDALSRGFRGAGVGTAPLVRVLAYEGAGVLLGSGSGVLSRSPIAGEGVRYVSVKLRCSCCDRGTAESARKWFNRGLKKTGLADLGAAFTLPDEVNSYLYDDRTRMRILDAVASGVDRQPSILVGHSLGSVVALDLAAHLPCSLKPRLLVTSGSPLRYDQVRDRMRALGVAQWSRSGRTTPWINVYDKGDIATKGSKLDPDDYGPLIQVGVNNGSGHHHSGTSYLAHPELARQISAHL